MVLLTTDRLILRNYKESDYNDVREYFEDATVAKYEDFDPMSDEEVKHLIREWKLRDNRLVAELKDTKKVIGSVGYWIDENGEYSIDFDFNQVYTKQGYATEAAKEIVRYVFEELKVARIYGDCDIHNENSWKLMERLGFKRMEQIDDASYKDCIDGRPNTISIYLYMKRNPMLCKNRS